MNKPVTMGDLVFIGIGLVCLTHLGWWGLLILVPGAYLWDKLAKWVGE